MDRAFTHARIIVTINRRVFTTHKVKGTLPFNTVLVSRHVHFVDKKCVTYLILHSKNQVYL